MKLLSDWSTKTLLILSIIIMIGCNGSVSPAPGINPPATPTLTPSPFPTATPPGGIVFETKTLRVKDLYITAEIADTPQKRQLGLMYRNELEENRGMLFIFPLPNYLSFWMKNTYIPLSIAFIDTNGIITEIEDMEPETTTSHVSQFLSQYALEMNQGWFEKNNIKVGDKVYVEDL